MRTRRRRSARRLCELSDLYGAIRAYARNKGLSMGDLKKMADITKRAFESGVRKPRD